MSWLIYVIILGALAGWIAGLLMKGRGFGVLGNILIGIVGAILGGWLFDALNISAGGGFGGQLITAVVGALVLVWIVGLVRRN